MRHLAEDGQHRALGRLADRVVGGIGGAGEGGGDEHRVDQLAGTAGQLLGGAADDLAEDHAGVAAGAHQRRPGQRLDQLGAADLVDLEPVEAVELLHHRPHRHRHVVAGVAVGDREDVEVVDLLAALLEVRRRRSVTTRRKRAIEGSGISSESSCRGRMRPHGADRPRSLACARSMRRFATWCTGHRKTVIIGWIVALIGVGMLSGSVGSDFSEDFKLPASDSQEAFDLLEDKFPAQSGDTATIVFKAEGGVESPAVKQRDGGRLRRSRKAPARQRSRQPLRGRRRRRRSARTARSPTRRSSSTSPPNKLEKEDIERS